MSTNVAMTGDADARRHRSVNRYIRAAVILAVAGMLMLIPILLGVSATAVGLFMFGSLLLTVAIVLYLAGVVRDLRQKTVL